MIQLYIICMHTSRDIIKYLRIGAADQRLTDTRACSRGRLLCPEELPDVNQPVQIPLVFLATADIQ